VDDLGDLGDRRIAQAEPHDQGLEGAAVALVGELAPRVSKRSLAGSASGLCESAKRKRARGVSTKRRISQAEAIRSTWIPLRVHPGPARELGDGAGVHRAGGWRRSPCSRVVSCRSKTLAAVRSGAGEDVAGRITSNEVLFEADRARHEISLGSRPALPWCACAAAPELGEISSYSAARSRRKRSSISSSVGRR